MSKTKKPYRHRFEVLRDESGEWCFVNADSEPKPVLVSRAVKSDTIWLASHYLRSAWSNLRIRSELTIKRRDGSIQDKRTFGDDPGETKG